MLCLWPLLFLKTEAWEKNSGKSLFLLWEKGLYEEKDKIQNTDQD